MFKLKTKPGDTLIEVMFAIAIFSAVAVSVISTMNSGTSSVQNNLETTMSRNAIDIQAEALRFIQSSYISEHDGAQQNYASTWKTITSLANEPTENITKFSVNSCEELYDRDNPKSIFSQNAFVINTRGLTVGKEGVNASTAVIKAVDQLGEANNKLFTPAAVYPRIMFRGENDTSLIDTNNSNIVNNVEGIYVVAVYDPDSTVTVEDGTDKTEKASAYYDFYIRTCWSNSRSNSAPTTISTVIRLYNPDINVVEDKKDYDYIDYRLYFDVNDGVWTGAAPSTIEAKDANARHRFGSINIANPTRPGYTFLGWQISNDDYGQYDRGNATYIKNAEKLLVNGDILSATREKPEVTLYAVWGKIVNVTINTGDATRGSIGGLENGWYSKTHKESLSGDSVTIQIPVGDNIVVTPKPEECLVFSDWYIGDKFLAHDLANYDITTDMTITAIFSKDITCIEEIYVLNVYPNVGDNLGSWMNTYGKVGGKQIIKTTSLAISSFNSNPNSIDANKYDVIVFGFWDSNNHMDLSLTSRNWLQNNWISAKKPIIFGHDTLACNYSAGSFFNSLASYAGIDFSSCKGGAVYASTSIKIIKESVFSTYPWNIRKATLTIPSAHAGQTVISSLQNNIFIMFNNNAPIPLADNFYLTVNGTGAMIQTGHSRGQATEDEQKILANLIFYLYSQYDK